MAEDVGIRSHIVLVVDKTEGADQVRMDPGETKTRRDVHERKQDILVRVADAQIP